MEQPDAGMAISFGAATLRDTADTGEAVLEEVYDQYARALYRYALSILGSSEDAEDAVQEVIVRMARERKRLRKVRNLRAYLFAAARNSAYTILRSRRRRDGLHEAIRTDFFTTPAAGPDDRPIESAMLLRALAELPIEQREVLVLKVFDQLTFKEIAETVGGPVSTITSRYRYGIARLRQALDEA